jgi:predicted aminopeptidase
MKSLKILLFFAFVLILLTGCGNILYISKLGWHQGFINFHSVPIQEILEDRHVDEGTKEKIRFIQEVKCFGEKRLGLKGTKSYTKFFEARGPILYVITASEKDRLQLYAWDFPIIGKVTYKGFFTKEAALKEEQSLEKKGLDTFIQQAGAYSTLGWLNDPIFSSMMKWNQIALANLILHEMTHATVYFKGETDFNEQLATFVGNRGAIDFLIEKYGKGSKEVAEAIHIQEDDLLFSRWVDQVCQRLSTYYAKEISRDEKLRGREEIFRSIKEEFRQIKLQFKTECYKDFDEMDLNNAVLLAYRQYIHRLERFEAIYEYLGRNLRKVVELFKEIKASREEPSAFLERWMKERGLTVSNYEYKQKMTVLRSLVKPLFRHHIRFCY